MGIGAGQEKTDAACIAQNDRTDLEQFQPNRRHLGIGQFRALERLAANGLHQHIGQGGEQQAK